MASTGLQDQKPARTQVKSTRTTKSNRALSSDQRKRRIVRLATPLFLERGYDSVSMNEIIAAVGGSKATIYSLFGNKGGLFDEVVLLISSDVTMAIDVHTSGTLEQQLTSIGRNFLDTVLSPQVLEFHRLMVSLGKTFPKASRTFYEAGPLSAYDIVRDWIKERQDAGEIRPGDPYQLSTLFLDMLIGEYQLAGLTNKTPTPTPKQIEAKLKCAVDLFMNGCATAP